VPPRAYDRDSAAKTDVWKYHLRFGGQSGGHSGFATYEAALYPQDTEFSYLPLDAQGQRAEVAFGDLSETLQNLLRSKRFMKRPVELSAEELEEILKGIRGASATA